MTLDDMPLSVVLTELAEAYETVAALPPVAVMVGGRAPGKPGSKVPPGMSEVLDADEHERAISDTDEWALYVAHHLLDVEPSIGSVPDSTPGRLRLASRWAEVLRDEPDLMARYAFESDSRALLATLRRLSRRGTRKVAIPTACLDVACTGTYVATIAGPGMSEDIVCSRCGDRVPRAQWERWGSQVEWVTVEHAMNLLGVETKMAVYQRAKREGWRRQGEGREVRYHVEDITRRMTA